MCAMAYQRAGLLAQIEAGVLNDAVPLSSLLQQCIVLGGRAGSEKMRDWARQELNGYVGSEKVPDYRHVPVTLMGLITNHAGYNGMTQRVQASTLPAPVREMVTKDIDLEDAILSQGVGELEALAAKGTDEHRLIPSWAEFIRDVLNKYCMGANSHTAAVFWSVPDTAIRGVLVRVRTALAELVAELVSLTPQDQETPDKLAADQAVQFVVTGDRATVNYTSQRAVDGGSNLTVASAEPGPVIVSGGSGTAIGSQTASGTNSSVLGTQTVQGTSNAVAGRDVQTHTAVNQVAPGFESVAQAVADVLAWLPEAGLVGQDRADAEQAGHEVLAEAVRAEPDIGKAKRALTILKGLLSPLAIRVMTGAAAGAGTEAQAGTEKAVKAIEGLMKASF